MSAFPATLSGGGSFLSQTHWPTVTSKLLSLPPQPPFSFNFVPSDDTTHYPFLLPSIYRFLEQLSIWCKFSPFPECYSCQILRNCHFYEPSPSNTLARGLLDFLISPMILSFTLPQPPNSQGCTLNFIITNICTLPPYIVHSPHSSQRVPFRTHMMSLCYSNPIMLPTVSLRMKAELLTHLSRVHVM